MPTTRRALAHLSRAAVQRREPRGRGLDSHCHPPLCCSGPAIYHLFSNSVAYLSKFVLSSVFSNPFFMNVMISSTLLQMLIILVKNDFECCKISYSEMLFLKALKILFPNSLILLLTKNWTLLIINIYIYHPTLSLDPEITSILKSMFSLLLL